VSKVAQKKPFEEVEEGFLAALGMTTPGNERGEKQVPQAKTGLGMTMWVGAI
jgi:hypothetical protein